MIRVNTRLKEILNVFKLAVGLIRQVVRRLDRRQVRLLDRNQTASRFEVFACFGWKAAQTPGFLVQVGCLHEVAQSFGE